MREGTDVRAIAPRGVRRECAVDSNRAHPDADPVPVARRRRCRRRTRALRLLKARAASPHRRWPALGPDGLPRPRRRRGSRGGRNRKRPDRSPPAASHRRDCRDASDDADVDGSIETPGVEAVAPKAGTGRAPARARLERRRRRQRLHRRRRPRPGAPGRRPDGAGCRGHRRGSAGRDRGPVTPPAHRRHPPAAPRPKIGDSRPAPASPAVQREATPRGRGWPQEAPPPPGWTRPVANRRGGCRTQRRRRRTNAPATRRGRRTSKAPSMPTTATARPACSTSLDDEQLEKRRGPEPQGPPDRSLPDGRARTTADGIVAHRGARRPQARSSTTSRRRPTTPRRSTATSISAACRTCCPGMEAAFIDIGTPKNGVLYRGDVAYDPSDVEGGEKPAHRAGAAQRPGDHRAGHEEPDRRTRARASRRR